MTPKNEVTILFGSTLDQLNDKLTRMKLSHSSQKQLWPVS